MVTSDGAFDVITIGRVSVDLYPLQSGVPLAQVQTFAKSLGGSPTNVAVAAARLGRRTAVITKVGTEGFGDYVRAALRDFGVDTRFVGEDDQLKTPVVFCELFPPDEFPIVFYREPAAPDMTIRPEELDLGAVASARIFWTSGTGLSAEPSRSATLGALRARGRSGITIHDLDHRPVFWKSPEDARACAQAAIGLASVVVGNLDEVEMAVGSREPVTAADRLLEMGVELAVIKLGPRGVYARRSDESMEIAPVEVDVVCGLGAGDAFGGALCHGLLAGWELARLLRYANAAGAIVASRLACADAMPTQNEVEEVVGRLAANA